MKNIKLFLTLFLVNIAFLSSTNCYGQYYIKLDTDISPFFSKKAEIFMNHPDANWMVNRINKEKDQLGIILKKLAGFNEHNDRDETDCCLACYLIRILNDRQLGFSEADRQIISQALKTLTTYFIRNSYHREDMEEAKKLFQNFDFCKLFIFIEDVQIKKTECTIF